MRLGVLWTSNIFIATINFLKCPILSSSTTEGNCVTIDAAFRVSQKDRTYFLSGGEYIEYSHHRESEAEVGPITNLGLDRRVNHSAAAFTLTNGALMFVKKCQYFR
ncbi:hypothetical protein ElyMa_001934300 [Elysia marginata]|uniref:Uncharacterized protein n=1 Tax=Elysia marginata TaxID=1093978 RepID=A0AAV4EVX9_9GAST|nr:hypothetical protein ElyMa_001934300 [Elysia marginata]